MGAPGEIDGLALVAELARKSGLCWVSYPGADRQHPVWHVWHDDAIGLVAGGEEQPLPGIEDHDEVVVLLRAKTNRHRVAAVRARVERVLPGMPGWDELVPALVAGRLNLVDRQHAPDRWATGCLVLRLVPVEVLQQPGTLPDASHAVTPVGSPATTAGRPPRMLHRRQTQRRPLS